MSKFYEIIKRESDLKYDMFINADTDRQKKEFLSRFAIAYELQKRCVGKREFEVIFEYLKLHNEMESELTERIKILGTDNESTKDIGYKLTELDLIGYYLRNMSKFLWDY